MFPQLGLNLFFSEGDPDTSKCSISCSRYFILNVDSD
jgi:hypothetical protein